MVAAGVRSELAPMPLLDALLDLVLAPVCLGCDGRISPGDSARLMCRRCESRLRRIPQPCCGRCGAPLRLTGRTDDAHGCPECTPWSDHLRLARSAFLLLPPADRFVHQLKYRGWQRLAEPMGRCMAAVPWPPGAHEPAVIVPVPTTAARQRSRGYNQAGLLARACAARTAHDVQPLLSRRPGARTQTSLQPAARAANVAGAFQASGPCDGLHVILVDDVLTTGATALECAAVLARAGACCTRLLTFARAWDSRE